MVSGRTAFATATAAALKPFEHLFKQNPLVRRVLIEQHQSAIGFEHGVKPADDADETERDAEQRRGSERWSEW
jgi:hypothetical protein